MTVSMLTGRDQPALALASRGPITSLRFAGRSAPALGLRLNKRQFTLGAANCDLLVPREMSAGVSARHATLDRVGDLLHVRDCDSQNGIFRSRAAPRSPALEIQSGDIFWVADVPLLAMDARLDMLRVHLGRHLGLDADAAIDAAAATIVSARPVLLVGALGTGARSLANIIHTTGTRHLNPLIVASPPSLSSLKDARGATVVIDLDKVPSFPARAAAVLFDPAYGFHCIFTTVNESRARARLDVYRDQVSTIALTPLASRPSDIARLLVSFWASDFKCSHNVDEIAPRALRALERYRWRRNLDELYEHSRRVHACLHHNSLRQAAAALGIRHQTLSGHLARIGLPAVRCVGEQPLVRGLDDDRASRACLLPR